MNCWICGEIADTGEHAIKKSDLQILFKKVSQKNPIYTESAVGKAVPIGSLKSPYFHLKSKICGSCNSTLSQPYDRSWERMSNYLQEHMDRNTQVIKLSSVFPKVGLCSMRYVHLYFLKIIGCIIDEKDMPIELEGFSRSIRNGVAHPCFYLGFGFIQRENNKNRASLSLEACEEVEGIIHAANWFYIIGNVYVDIVYAKNKKYSKVYENIWHPRLRKNI